RMNQLFTHTSGIVYPIFTYKGRAGYMKEKIIDAWPGEDISLEENIKRLAGVPLAHEPGEGHTYGMNMDVLGRVIEVLDGRPFAKYMREELFRPLKMKDTGFAVPKNKWNRMPSVYTTKNGKLALFDESVFDEKAPNNKPEWWKRNPDKIALGGAGIISTAYDYARFLQMLVNDGELDGERILGRKTVDMISRGVHQSNPESSTASGLSVGVVINSEKHLHPESQGSFNGGGYFYTSFWVDPQEKFIGILLSQINPGYSQLAGNFKLMGYSALK
ncbi:MAG: serine hydrolase domain-containing protein, partial [Verrucomicrobiota bacterium]|nr:serine hydrolase domain-containing protein [Verrucomicrobiota bacterium]